MPDIGKKLLYLKLKQSTKVRKMSEIPTPIQNVSEQKNKWMNEWTKNSNIHTKNCLFPQSSDKRQPFGCLWILFIRNGTAAYSFILI